MRARRGPRLPQRLRATAACATSRRCAGCSAAFGPDAFRVELQRPFWPPRPRAQPRAGGAGPAARRAVRGDRQRPRPHAARAPLQDAFVAIREHTTLDASEPLRRGNHAHVLASPEAMAARFADHPEAVAETARLAETLTLRPHAGPRLPLPGRRGRRRRPRAGRGLRRALRRALPARRARRPRAREAAARAWSEELDAHRARSGLSGFFLLHHELLELAREVAVEVRGAGTVARAAAAGARPRVLRVVDRLLPHRPLARRPGRQRAVPRALPQRGDHVAARHRPRLPARRPRGADPARARALRARALGARRGVPDLSARAARSASSARRSACRRGRSSASRAARRAGAQARRARHRRWRWGRTRPARRAAGRWLATLAQEAHGLPRHLSQHSGGMIVATRPLIDCCPVVPAAMEGRQMVMWDKDSCADAGFLKIDLLGLGMLSAVERCVEHDRRATRRADRPLADPLRRPGDLRVHPERRDDRRLPDREPRADGRRCGARGPRTSTTSRSRSRSCGPGRSRAARSTPTSSAASGCARTRPTRSPTTTRRWSPCCATRSGRSSSRTRSSRSRWRSRASRRARPRGCGGR